MEKKKGFVNENGSFELSEYEKERAISAREQFKNWTLISNSDVKKKAENWLKSKNTSSKTPADTI